ncbi:Hypothetical predicted protein, partial [Pelobates cultripes]
MPAKLVRLGPGSDGHPDEDAFSGEPGYDILDEYQAGSSGATSPGEGVPDHSSQYVQETVLDSPLNGSQKVSAAHAGDPGRATSRAAFMGNSPRISEFFSSSSFQYQYVYCSSKDLPEAE